MSAQQEAAPPPPPGAAAVEAEARPAPEVGGELAVYGSEPSNQAELDAISQLRERILQCPEYDRVKAEAQAYVDDKLLHRFLCARNHNLNKSEAMLKKHIQWRFENMRPFELRCADMEAQARTGKVQCSPHGLDCYGRPVLILDNSKENLTEKNAKKKQRLAMQYLAFNLERASRQMRGGVQRHVVFITLEDFSLWQRGKAKVQGEGASKVQVQGKRWRVTVQSM